MSRFATLDSLRKREDGDDDDNAKRNYTGGGLNVYDPRRGGGAGGRRPADDDDSSGGEGGVEGIFRQRGAGGAPPPGPGEAITITFYKNGFIVGDGDLRKYDDPGNKKFVDDVNKGIVPTELEALARSKGRHLSVAVEDKRGDDYVPPPYKAFSGAGQAVGGGAPRVAAATAVVPAGSAGHDLQADPSRPTTTLQVRLLDGRRERVTINTDASVADLQAKVAFLKGAGGKAFVLVAGFPPKTLDKPSATIEEAGLKGAAVTQQAAP